MHSQDTINQLVDLRSEGKSCRAIAAALNMSVGAAHKLAHDHDDEIQQLRNRAHPLPAHKNEHFQYKNEHPWGWGGVQKC